MSNDKTSSPIRLCSTTALVVGAALTSPFAIAQTPPIEAFAALPAMQSPMLSPNGTQLAFITQDETASLILVANLEDMSITSAIQLTEAKPRAVFWANEEALVFTAGLTTSLVNVPGQIEATNPYGVDLTADAKVTMLLKNRSLRTQQNFVSIDGARFVGFQRSSGRVLYSQFDVDRNRVLFAVDPKNDRQSVVDRASGNTFNWAVDESGEPIYRGDYDQRSNWLMLFAKRGRSWKVLVSASVEIPQLSFYGLDDNGDLVVGTRPKGTDHFGLYTLSTETGEIGEPILFHDEFDVGGARIDPYTNRVIGAGIADLGPVWFDDELAEHQTLLNEAFPGESPIIVSWSEDRSRFIVMTENEDHAPAVYFYDALAPSVNQIASTYTALQGVRLPARRPYTYTARDGTLIPGYLTRPLDANGPTALIVLPHGGPAARDVDGFDWMAHFLASRGYTVLQPNFRGSGGYGDAWETAGHGEWGIGVMQHDLSDGVAALVDERLADPDRVCIVGASYGGYAALAGAVFTPELYRCAAAIAPVADLVDILGFERNRRGGFSAAVSYWRRAMGGGDSDGLNDRLRAASPAAHADRAEAPILLIHGRDDAVVPLQQSRTMESELRSAGKRVEFIELEGEDHWLSGATTRLATLQALDRFLAENLAE